MYLLTYGTLKKDKPNHYYLDSAEFIKEVEFKGNHTMFTLLRNSQGNLYKLFPCLIKTPDIEHTIIGEIYKIDELMLEDLDRLESNGSMYQREEVEIEGLTCLVYYYIAKTTNSLMIQEDEF